MHKHDTWIGVGSGITGGMVKYATLNQIQVSFSHKLVESLVIAAGCALVSLLVKETYYWAKKKWFKK